MSIMRRRRYSKEFKSDAVAMVLHGGKSVKEVAEDLGLNRNLLSRWRREELEGMDRSCDLPKGGMKPSDIEAENQQLRRELARIREQRDILKKAVGIFSRQPDKYTDS